MLQRNLPVAAKNSLPDYDACLPTRLRADADSLIRYLHELPWRRLRTCPWCDSTGINPTTQGHARLARYRCTACRRSSNALSGTPFSDMRYPERWSTFAVYMLAGWSSIQVATAMNTGFKVYYSWGAAVKNIMSEQYPDLHDWWVTRHSRENLRPSAQVAAQQQAMIKWLDHRLTAQNPPCPGCKLMPTYRFKGNRPRFQCQRCATSFSLFADTPLKGMIHCELWVDFLKRLMDGYSVHDLKMGSGIGMGAATRWRQQFLLLIEAENHAELLKWITWMRRRRSNEILQFVREGGVLERATRSVFPQGARTGGEITRKKSRRQLEESAK